MLQRGVYPAAVTPFDERGRIDLTGVAKLLAWFEAAGCKGVVLAGTNGEGPSLSAVEKRDLMAGAAAIKGKLDLILGIATPSLDEAVSLCKQAANSEAVATLVMPPFYFREASENGIYDWFSHVLDRSPVPVLVYNYPMRTGVSITPELMERLGQHERMAGAKDSSRLPENISAYRCALSSEKCLFTGGETLLLDSLTAGWTGTISGAANVIPDWISRIVFEWFEEGWRDSAETKFQLILPVLQAIGRHPQPAGNKAVLEKLGVITNRRLRAPLTETPQGAAEEVLREIEAQLGLRTGSHPEPRFAASAAGNQQNKGV